MSFEGFQECSFFLDLVNTWSEEQSYFACLDGVALNNLPSALGNFEDCELPGSVRGQTSAELKGNGHSAVKSTKAKKRKIGNDLWRVTGPEDYAHLSSSDPADGLGSPNPQSERIQPRAINGSATQELHDEVPLPAQNWLSTPIKMALQFCGIQVTFHIQVGTAVGAPESNRGDVEGQGMHSNFATLLRQLADVLSPGGVVRA